MFEEWLGDLYRTMGWSGRIASGSLEQHSVFQESLGIAVACSGLSDSLRNQLSCVCVRQLGAHSSPIVTETSNSQIICNQKENPKSSLARLATVFFDRRLDFFSAGPPGLREGVSTSNSVMSERLLLDK